MNTLKTFAVSGLLSIVLISCGAKNGSVPNKPVIPANGITNPVTTAGPAGAAGSADYTGGINILGSWSTGCFEDSDGVRRIITWDFFNNIAVYTAYNYEESVDVVAGTCTEASASSPAPLQYTFYIGSAVSQPAKSVAFDLYDGQGTLFDILSYDSTSDSFTEGDETNLVGSNDGSSQALRLQSLDTSEVFKRTTSK